MNNWTTRFSPGQQAQGLDDLEDILNSPSPALGPTSFDPGHLPLSDYSQKAVSASDGIVPAAIPDTDSGAANVLQQPSSATGSSFAITSEAAHPDALLQEHRHARKNAIEPQKASASDGRSDNQSAFRSQYLLDLMARNKAATAAATVAGAAAGGAVAGPFGMAAGAKTGALMVAVGAAAAGAAQHYYLPVAIDKPVAASPSPQPCTDSDVKS